MEGGEGRDLDGGILREGRGWTNLDEGSWMKEVGCRKLNGGTMMEGLG